jgi:hypothetical protein
VSNVRVVQGGFPRLLWLAASHRWSVVGIRRWVRCQVSEPFWWSLSPGIGGVGASVVSVSGDVDLEQLRRAAERFRADREDVDDWRLTTRQRWVNRVLTALDAPAAPHPRWRARRPASGNTSGSSTVSRAVAAGAGHRGQEREGDDAPGDRKCRYRVPERARFIVFLCGRARRAARHDCAMVWW